MGVFRRTAPEKAARALKEFMSYPSETRSIVLGGGGGTFVQPDWVNKAPSAYDLQASIGQTRALTGTIAVYACVALIAESISSLPCLTYRRLDEDHRERVPERNDTPGPLGWMQRLARMLHTAPNPEMTSQEFWETVLGHLLLWGNAYVNVLRENGRPTELWPLRPDHIEIERDDRGVRRYRYYVPSTGKQMTLGPNEVMHVRGFSVDGVLGISPIAVARRAIQISMEAERFAASFYRNGAALGGLLISDPPGRIPKQNELKEFKDQFEELYGGMDNAHRIAVLAGVRWQQTGMPLEDAQFLETRRFELNDIARLYRIPPHMVGDVERSTSWGTGIEQQGIGFVVYTLRPWIERLEQASNRDLGFPGVSSLLDEGIYAEFLVDGLLRGDMKSRYDAYAVALINQFMTPNEVRKLENLEPLPGGDEPITPAGAQPAAPAPDPLALAASNGHGEPAEPAWWR